MHNHVSQIHQDPAGCIHAFNAADDAAGFMNYLAYFCGNSLHLCIGIPVADDEIVTDR
ncbi:hypothetical protein D3C74_483770 [compost metagenome]